MGDHGDMIALDAPAKINLYLHVLGRRDDGYHLLDSLIVFAGCGDRIEATPGSGLSVEITGPFAAGLDGGSDNLVTRAAHALADAAGIKPDAALTLTKNLPVSSGIGGGSADAAATLRALDRLWALDMPASALKAIGEILGADVPVCLAGGPSFVGGIGADIAPAPALPDCWLVLANPGVAVSTPAVFAARTGAFGQPARFEAAPETAADLAALLAGRRNDLTAPAIQIAPVIGDVLAALDALPGALLTRMSGSGATCFALFAGPSEADAAAERLRADHADWWVAAAPILAAAA